MVEGKIALKDSMPLKHALAAALSLLLLCASSFASACELSCSLAPSHPVSSQVSGSKDPSTALASEPAASAVTTSHSHCGHAGTARQSSAVTQHFEDASTCTSAPCTQAQIFSTPMSGKDSVQIESTHLAVTIAIVSPVSRISTRSDIVKLQHAPPKSLLLDPLSIALRI
jgi:hypothetical protein